jgi:hypothetical protein
MENESLRKMFFSILQVGLPISAQAEVPMDGRNGKIITETN